MELLVHARDELGESVLWAADEGTLYWLDLQRPTLHRWSPAMGHSLHPIDLPPPLGALLPTAAGTSLLLAAGRRLLSMDRGTARLRATGAPELANAGAHVNDAKTDAAGTVWIATADDAETEPLGGLYRVDPDGATEVASGFPVTNGPAFSADGREVYPSDSVRGTVLALAVDGPDRSEPRVLVRLDEDEGLPDGLAVDADGGVWVAHWGGACVSRYSAGGELLARLDVPAPNITSVVFGGADLDELFVTTARLELSRSHLADHPLSGGLFRTSPGVRGVPPAPTANW